MLVLKDDNRRLRSGAWLTLTAATPLAVTIVIQIYSVSEDVGESPQPVVYLRYPAHALFIIGTWLCWSATRDRPARIVFALALAAAVIGGIFFFVKRSVPFLDVTALGLCCGGLIQSQGRRVDKGGKLVFIITVFFGIVPSLFLVPATILRPGERGISLPVFVYLFPLAVLAFQTLVLLLLES